MRLSGNQTSGDQIWDIAFGILTFELSRIPTRFFTTYIYFFLEVYEDTTEPEEDTKCGFGSIYPKWLQIFASKKAFVVVYALAGMQQFIVSSYSVGTMSTMEKNFKMSSRQSGKRVVPTCQVLI